MSSRKRDVRLGVIIAAAGESRRMKSDTPKVLMDLAGMPVLAHSMDVFSGIEEVERVVISAPPSLATLFRKLARGEKDIRVVKGGRLRQESVERALAKMGRGVDYVAIHDGARPLVTRGLVRRVLKKAIKTGAAIPAVEPNETVKKKGPRGTVAGTADRRRLLLAQTPQIFEAELYREALKRARATGGEFTDDASMVEALGYGVWTVKGDYRNLKITRPEDMRMALALLRK